MCKLLLYTWLLEKSAKFPTKQLLYSVNMVVIGKISQKPNETITLLLKHGHWKNQQKGQLNSYFATKILFRYSEEKKA